MTLHEAIEFILQESGRPMSSREIADIINKSKLYLRRDGKSVSASQVSARVGNYEKVFVKDSGKIKLLKDDYVSLKLQNYKNKLKYLVGSSNHHSIGGKMAILIDALEALKFESNKESDYDSNDSQVSEPGATYRSALNRDKFKVAFRLCNWYLSQDSSFRVILTAQFVSVLSGLNWFQKGNHILSTEVPNSNHFLLKIVGDNPKSNFKIDNKQSQTHEFNEDLIDSKLNRQVEDFIN